MREINLYNWVWIQKPPPKKPLTGEENLTLFFRGIATPVEPNTGSAPTTSSVDALKFENGKRWKLNRYIKPSINHLLWLHPKTPKKMVEERLY